MELEFRVDVCVRGQHMIYKDIWHAVVGEVLVCESIDILDYVTGIGNGCIFAR